MPKITFNTCKRVKKFYSVCSQRISFIFIENLCQHRSFFISAAYHHEIHSLKNNLSFFNQESINFLCFLSQHLLINYRKLLKMKNYLKITPNPVTITSRVFILLNVTKISNISLAIALEIKSNKEQFIISENR